jgi:hypothetical protein
MSRPRAWLLLCATLAACNPGGIAVTLTNRSAGELTGVVLRFTGGAGEVARLAPGASHRFAPKPTSESHLVVEFDAAGARRSHVIDVYFEPGYQVAIDIVVDAQGQVTWKER